MKNLLKLGAILCCFLMTQYGYSQNDDDYRGYPGDGCQQEVACPQPDQPCGECWCLFKHEEPCYYLEKRCIEVPQYYKKQCCRYVPKTYEVKRCRYVPQYYTETCCKYEPEYYCTDECRMCKKWICERKCRYVPRYYYKKVCGNPALINQGMNQGAPQGCPAQG